MLRPDGQKYKDLKKRQQIAEQARPKPTASDLRFKEVLDPEGARASQGDREAARQRWLDEMQAKADPKQIRRAVREREEQERERERAEDRAQRQEFEKQWWEREGNRRAVQQARTAEVNTQARRHWADVELQASQPATDVPTIPPEDVDFSAVRRKMATERVQRGAALVAPRLTAAAGHSLGGGNGADISQGSSSVGSTRSHLVAAQDKEYQLSVLHDQLRNLRADEAALQEDQMRLHTHLELAEQQQRRAEERLARYGENPKLQAEADEAASAAESVRRSLMDLQPHLDTVNADINEKQSMLTCLRAA